MQAHSRVISFSNDKIMWKKFLQEKQSRQIFDLNVIFVLYFSLRQKGIELIRLELIVDNMSNLLH